MDHEQHHVLFGGRKSLNPLCSQSDTQQSVDPSSFALGLLSKRHVDTMPSSNQLVFFVAAGSERL